MPVIIVFVTGLLFRINIIYTKDFSTSITALGEGNFITTESDGTKVITLENDWTIVTKPDGTRIYSHGGEFQEIRFPSGTGYINYPKETVYSFPYENEEIIMSKQELQYHDIYGNKIVEKVDGWVFLTDYFYGTLNRLFPDKLAIELRDHWYHEIYNKLSRNPSIAPNKISLIVSSVLLTQESQEFWFHSQDRTPFVGNQVARNIVILNSIDIHNPSSPRNKKLILAHITTQIYLANIARTNGVTIASLLDNDEIYFSLLAQYINEGHSK